jgi:hypothetical protein
VNVLPIGWTEESWGAFSDKLGLGGAQTDPFALIRTLVGWLITAFAVTLGAPFWFDLLKSFVNIRSSGRPPAAASNAAQ